MGPNPQDFYSKYHYNYPPSINIPILFIRYTNYH